MIRACAATHTGAAGAGERPGTPRLGRAAALAYCEWGPAHGDAVLLAHATGFHARCWDAVARALPASQRVIAVDLRGHGRSTKQGPFDWGQFGTDLAAFVDALGLVGVLGVGHSLGGFAVTQAAGARPARFKRLLLVDPVIFSPERYVAPAPGYLGVDDHPVARRRNAWASPEEMFQRFAARHPFRLWRAEVLMDYCRHGLVPAGNGFALACPPRIEAAIYMGSAGIDIGAVVAALPHPVTVLRAGGNDADGAPRQPMDFARSPTWPGLAAAFPNGRDVYLPALTHFMPMQCPALVAAHIADLLGEA